MTLFFFKVATMIAEHLRKYISIVVKSSNDLILGQKHKPLKYKILAIISKLSVLLMEGIELVDFMTTSA